MNKKSKTETTPKRIRYETFLKKFMNNPQKFYISENELQEVPKNADLNYVWTLLNIDGRRSIVAGWHYVNRDGYLMSKVPHNGEDISVMGVVEGIEYNEA